jgi:hypothetical protein
MTRFLCQRHQRQFICAFRTLEEAKMVWREERSSTVSGDGKEWWKKEQREVSGRWVVGTVRRSNSSSICAIVHFITDVTNKLQSREKWEVCLRETKTRINTIESTKILKNKLNLGALQMTAKEDNNLWLPQTLFLKIQDTYKSYNPVTRIVCSGWFRRLACSPNLSWGRQSAGHSIPGPHTGILASPVSSYSLGLWACYSFCLKALLGLEYLGNSFSLSLSIFCISLGNISKGSPQVD